MSNATRTSELSPRQAHILALWCQGIKHKDIAAMLHISLNAFQEALRQCMWKLEIESRDELRRYAIAHGYDHVEKQS